MELSNQEAQLSVNELKQKISNLERRVQRLTTDSVTKLLKKEGIIDKIMENDETIIDVLDGPVAIISIDFDEFKEINDKFGHAKGDIYLGDISSEIDRLAWGQGDEVGFAFRGKEGDEVVAVLKIEGNSEDEYFDRVNRFKDGLEESLRELGKMFPNKGIERTNPSLSLGAVFKPRGIFSNSPLVMLDRLLTTVDEKADKALYETKQNKNMRAEDKLVDVTFFEKINNV